MKQILAALLLAAAVAPHAALADEAPRFICMSEDNSVVLFSQNGLVDGQTQPVTVQKDGKLNKTTVFAKLRDGSKFVVVAPENKEKPGTGLLVDCLDLSKISY